MTTPTIPKASGGSGFGISNILGLVFILIGALLVLNLIGYKLPIDLNSLNKPLQYGAALGSIIGGLSMLFKKKDSIAGIK